MATDGSTGPSRELPHCLPSTSLSRCLQTPPFIEAPVNGDTDRAVMGTSEGVLVQSLLSSVTETRGTPACATVTALMSKHVCDLSVLVRKLTPGSGL